MKKGILVGVLLAFVLFLAACTKVVPVFEQYESGDELISAVAGKQLTTPVKKLDKAALEWARTGVKYKYLLTPSDSRVGTQPYLERVKGVSAEDTAFSEYSDTFTLHATLCTVDFVPWNNRTENLQELSNNFYPDDTYRYYRAKVLILSAEQDGVATCIGIRYPGEFDSEELGREAYLRAAEIQELSISLKPFPEKPLPEGFTVVPLQSIIGNHTIAQMGYLNDDVFAAAYWDKTDTPQLFHAGVLLFDRAGRLIKDVTIGDFTENKQCYDANYRFGIEDGKIVLNNYKEIVNGTPVIDRRYIVDAKGNVTIGAVAKPKDAVVMRLIPSPDGLKQAYSEKNSLYLKDAKGIKLLFEGHYSEEYVGSSYSPYQWIDNNLLICTAVYYEGKSTIVVDSNTGKDIIQAAGSPIFERKGKLYCEGYGEGGGYYVEALDLNKLETIQLIPGKVQFGVGSAKFSDNNLFCFQRSYSPDQKNHFAVVSLDDGSVLKDCSFYQEGMRNEFLLLSDTLAVLFRDKDMLLVDLEKLK